MEHEEVDASRDWCEELECRECGVKGVKTKKHRLCQSCHCRWWRAGSPADYFVPPRYRMKGWDDFIFYTMMYPTWSNSKIAERIGVCKRTVERYRARQAQQEEKRKEMTNDVSTTTKVRALH